MGHTAIYIYIGAQTVLTLNKKNELKIRKIATDQKIKKQKFQFCELISRPDSVHLWKP